MSTKRILTVTIATTSLNEEANIAAFIDSVLLQKEIGFKIKKILVVSDGSTDGTEKVANSFKDNRIVVKAFKSRAGKAARLNYVYKNLDTNILVQCDSDIVLGGPFVVKELVQHLMKSTKTMMCGGNSFPFEGITLTEKAINCSHRAYARLRKYSKSLSVTGQLIATKAEFIKHIRIPTGTAGDDIYVYFSCLTQGYKYSYAEKAIVYFRLPSTIQDQVKQNARFLSSPSQMSRYFDQTLIDQEDYIPKDKLVLSILHEYIRHPFLCSFLFCMNLFARAKASFHKNAFDTKWSMVRSTKKLNI